MRRKHQLPIGSTEEEREGEGEGEGKREREGEREGGLSCDSRTHTENESDWKK